MATKRKTVRALVKKVESQHPIVVILNKERFLTRKLTLDQVWGYSLGPEGHKNIENAIHKQKAGIYTHITTVSDAVFRQLYNLKKHNTTMPLDGYNFCQAMQSVNEYQAYERDSRARAAGKAFLVKHMTPDFCSKLENFKNELGGLRPQSAEIARIKSAIEILLAYRRDDMDTANFFIREYIRVCEREYASLD